MKQNRYNMENISEEEFKKAQRVIEDYNIQQKEKEMNLHKGIAKSYIALKGWLVNKKNSGKIDELEKEFVNNNYY